MPYRAYILQSTATGRFYSATPKSSRSASFDLNAVCGSVFTLAGRAAERERYFLIRTLPVFQRSAALNPLIL